jgi:hypothetical protein
MLTMTRPVKLVKTKPGGPGGIDTVSMFTVPPAVTSELRTKPRPGGPGGMAKGNAATNVWLGSFATKSIVTTFVGDTAIVAAPSGVVIDGFWQSEQTTSAETEPAPMVKRPASKPTAARRESPRREEEMAPESM